MGNVSGRVVLFTLAGIAAGLLTWFFSDLSGLIHLPDTSGALSSRAALEQNIVCSVFGALIAVLLGVADTLATGVQGRWVPVIGYGVVVGAFAGIVGIMLGMAVYGPLHSEEVRYAHQFLINAFARGLGWAFIGGLAGTADGIRKWSPSVIRNGVIGGLIGGFIGGMIFEIVPYLTPGVSRPAVISRLFGFVITGAMIGLFIALVQQLLKEAWIRVAVGKNEGKEFLVEKQETKIGRAELSDVPLFGDPNIARVHALLVADGQGRFLLRDVSQSSSGILVNGERVSGETTVKNGDQIQIASKTLFFFERLTKQRTAPAPKDVAARPQPRPADLGMGPKSLADLPGPGMSGGVFAPPAPNNGGAREGYAVSASGTPIIGGGGGQTRLIATSGPHAGMTFVLQPGAVIGRDPANAIPIPADTGASRQHARIVQEALSFAIEDAGSTNGTYVNGQRVSRQALVPGDMVGIGSTQFRVE